MASRTALLTGYNTHRPEDKQAMLESIGCTSVESLFAAVPSRLRLTRPLDLPAAMPEWELTKHLESLAARNATTKTHACYLGGGAYEHYIPAVIDAIVSRGEFLTSYTPYQPEISQGLLQSLFEYQTALAAVTGLPVVNGSCYDGSTALADAAWTCCLISGKHAKAELVVSNGIWPHWREVVGTYMDGRAVVRHTATMDNATGRTDLVKLEQAFSTLKPAGFLFQTPNAFGVFEDVKAITDICARHGVTSVCAFNPLAAGLVTPPGELGADIVVCDGQPLGLPLSAGGPSLGVYATKKEYRKYVPGRLIGKVTDINGNLAYALVYEDREQHVARERATSNICSNQALNALRAVIYLSSLGERGFANIATLNTRKAHYLAEQLAKIPSVKLPYTGTFFNEFIIELPKPAAHVLAAMQAEGFFAGIEYGEQRMLVAVTETKSKADLDRYAAALRKALA